MRSTKFIRAAAEGGRQTWRRGDIDTWVPSRLTDAQKSDAVNIDPGDMLQFHEHVPGHGKGSRLIVGEGTKLPLQHPDRFEVYRPSQLSLAANDRVRITVNGKTKDGKHRLNNGDLFTVKGFTPQGDVIVGNGWVISKDFGHLDYGYAVTSQAAQGKTVDKIFLGISSQSFGATNQRSAYVSLTRGRMQAVVFTDSKADLLRAVQHPDSPISATEFAEEARRRAGFKPYAKTPCCVKAGH